MFDLVNNKSFTFSYEHRKNVARIALNPQSTLLISVDDDGRAILVNMVRRSVLHHFNFKDKVGDIKFSPDGSHFAVAAGRNIQIWKTPDSGEKQFAPFVRHRIYTGHYADVTAIEWSPDSRFFLSSSKDLTARIYSLDAKDSAAAMALGGHRDSVVGAFFSEDQECIYTIGKDGALYIWKYKTKPDDEDGTGDLNWRIVERHLFKQEAKVRCAAFHAASNLLVVGFANGVFGLYELPEYTQIQTLSISQNEIDYVTINNTGEWLAFGAAKLGQLLVWEWKSESYILKQQGHFDSLNALVYSPDGTKIVTGAEDGKIKVWDAISGFCIVTFNEHSGPVTDLKFSKRGNVLFSCSLDGSVRAWDLIRYRNFRTFTAAERIQFTSLAIDPSGEIVCAGSEDEFDIHLWSVQTAKLLDRLAGHTGPVSSLAFASEGGLLISGSWDRTVRIWNIFSRTSTTEPLQVQNEVMSVDIRPDSRQIAVAATDGQISFWDPEIGSQQGNIDGREDITGGRHMNDRFESKNSARSKYFTTICYSSDGSTILAGGLSKHICLYDVDNEVLLKKFVISRNMTLDGTLEKFNSKNMTANGPLDLIDTTGEASDLEDRIDNTLPGSQRGDASTRKTRPAIRTTGIQFSPTNRSFSAASTEGLLIYSIDDLLLFDPFDLDIDITVSTTLEKLQEKEYLLALIMAFRLGERKLVHQVYENVPINDINLVAKELPQVYLARMFEFFSTVCQETQHVEFHLLWLQALVTNHGRFITSHMRDFASSIRGIQKFVTRLNNDISRVTAANLYTVEFLMDHTGEESQAMDLDRVEPSDNEEEYDSVDDSEWEGLEESRTSM